MRKWWLLVVGCAASFAWGCYDGGIVQGIIRGLCLAIGWFGADAWEQWKEKGAAP